MRLQLLILLILFDLGNQNCQSINCKWIDYSYGLDNYCNSVECDLENNLISSGYFKDLILGDFHLKSSSENHFDTYIVKYDQNGKLNWLHQFGGNGNCMEYYIKCDSKNNIIVAGMFDGSFSISNINFNCINYQAIYLIKFDPEGNIIWGNQFDGVTTISSLCVDKNDNIFVSVEGCLDFLSYNFKSIQSNQFIAKINPEGSIEWHKETYNAYISSKNKLTVNNNGDLFYTGSFNDSLIFNNKIYYAKKHWVRLEYLQPDGEYKIDSVFINTEEFYLARMDNNGDEDWIKFLEGDKNVSGINIASNENNIFVLTNYDNNLKLNPENQIKGSGICILNYKTNGDFINYTNYANGDFINYSNTTPGYMTCNNDFIVITGENISENIFLKKYDIHLNQLESINFGGNSTDIGTSICLDANNNIYLGGLFESDNFNLGSFRFQNDARFSFNLFVARFDQNITGNSNIFYGTKIYPNPFNEFISINTYAGDKIIRIELYNLIGQLILNHSYNTNTLGDITLYLPNLEKGIYFMNMYSDDQKYTEIINKK